ncbi:MAG: hypothetical protein C5B49_02380 [Bdellovibrio sp.]|nr:MAG: hypothetical protein C5B49_02380 [Bdellovibrio sp.]
MRPFYIGARGLGMGGAQIGVVDDETALAVNPAGLGRLRDVYGTLVDPEIEGSINWPGIYLSQAFSNPFDPAAMEPSLAASPGKPFHAKAQLFPSFVARNFGIGIFGRYLFDGRVDATGTNLQTYYQNDLAVLMGFNFRLWGGRIKLGIVGKAISRIEINKAIPVAGALDIPSNASEGAGVGFDSGLTLTAPIVWLPSISVVARDIGGTRFDTITGVRMTTATQPAPLSQDYDVALSVTPIHSKNSRSVFTIEYDKLLEAQQAADKVRYGHVGYEYNLADVFFLRLGMNGRYWTTGFEIASEHTQIQLAYYGAEIGPAGAPEEDRRWVWKFVFRF